MSRLLSPEEQEEVRERFSRRLDRWLNPPPWVQIAIFVALCLFFLLGPWFGWIMNRRTFLGLLGVAPIAALAPWRPFDWRYALGTAGVDVASGPDRVAFIWLDPGPRPFGLTPGVTQQRFLLFEGDARWDGALEPGTVHEAPLRLVPSSESAFSKCNFGERRRLVPLAGTIS